MPTIEEILNQNPQAINAIVAQMQGGQPIQQPMQQAQPQQAVQLPALPNLGAVANQNAPQSLGGQFLNALGEMAQAAATTAKDVIPSAVVNRALFGDRPIAYQMTYRDYVNTLEKKAKAEETQKQNTIADIGSSLYALEDKANEYGIKPEVIRSAVLGGTPTGNQEIDEWVGKFKEMTGPMMKAGKFGASDLLVALQKNDELRAGIAAPKYKPTEFEQKVMLAQKDPKLLETVMGAGKKDKGSYKYIEDEKGGVSIYQDGALISGSGKGKDTTKKISTHTIDDSGMVTFFDTEGNAIKRQPGGKTKIASDSVKGALTENQVVKNILDLALGTAGKGQTVEQLNAQYYKEYRDLVDAGADRETAYNIVMQKHSAPQPSLQKTGTSTYKHLWD